MNPIHSDQSSMAGIDIDLQVKCQWQLNTNDIDNKGT